MKKTERYPSYCPKCGALLTYIDTKWGRTAVDAEPVPVIFRQQGRYQVVRVGTGEIVRADRHIGGLTYHKDVAYIPHFYAHPRPQQKPDPPKLEISKKQTEPTEEKIEEHELQMSLV